jgi:hypothetical protein
MKVSEQTKGPVTNGHVPADTAIPFDAGVDEAKKILANIEKVSDAGHLRIGEIADKLETKYGDRTLAKFAEAIGKSPSCVKRWLSVYRAWKNTQIVATWPQSKTPPYSVLRELQDIPDREQIILDDPKMTVREAIALKREREGKDKNKGKGAGGSAKGGQKEPQGSFRTDKRRFLKEVCTNQEALRRKAEEALQEEDEQLDELARVAGKLSLENLRADARVMIALTEDLLERRRQLELDDETAQTEPAHADAGAQQMEA